MVQDKRASSGDDTFAALGELLAALTQALVAGTPEEITVLARHVEELATSLTAVDSDPARLAAIATLRDRAALLVQTLFTTNDRFLARALELQALGQQYRPGPNRNRAGAEGSGLGASLTAYRNGFSDLRA